MQLTRKWLPGYKIVKYCVVINFGQRSKEVLLLAIISL